MDYQLIAFDMDGTLLDSSKRVLPSSVSAIARAAERGKSVAACSGRCPAMVAHHHSDMPSMRYAICSSGATLYDLDEGRILSTRSFPHDVIAQIREVAGDEDYSPDAFSGRDFFYPTADLESLGHYGAGIYISLFREVGIGVRDVWETIGDPSVKTQKIDLHFADRGARDRVLARMRELDVELAYSESTTIEVSPAGTNKGTGLADLCRILDIPIEASIGVGDSNNDLPMLRVAGLAVAMANGNDDVRTLADVIVSDNDHDGCAEAIERFLLGGEHAERNGRRRP